MDFNVAEQNQGGHLHPDEEPREAGGIYKEAAGRALRAGRPACDPHPRPRIR